MKCVAPYEMPLAAIHVGALVFMTLSFLLDILILACWIIITKTFTNSIRGGKTTARTAIGGGGGGGNILPIMPLIYKLPIQKQSSSLKVSNSISTV